MAEPGVGKAASPLHLSLVQFQSSVSDKWMTGAPSINLAFVCPADILAQTLYKFPEPSVLVRQKGTKFW